MGLTESRVESKKHPVACLRLCSLGNGKRNVLCFEMFYILRTLNYFDYVCVVLAQECRGLRPQEAWDHLNFVKADTEN